MSLKSRIVERIRAEGPMSVAEYMTLCLLDPVDGYYPTRDPQDPGLGEGGDFITAPEISQMFGEVLGLWVLQSWRDLGAPPDLKLVELGPGRGTLMSDMLRSLRLDPGAMRATSVHLVEASSALQAVQGRTLSMSPCPVIWHDRLEDVPAGPTIVIGNEFLDCLPVRQFIQSDPFAGARGWRERVVTVDDGQLAFAASTGGPGGFADHFPGAHEDARLDDLMEVRPAVAQIVDTLRTRFDHRPGRALFLDYGPNTTEFGDTLQALRRHEKVDVLDEPGRADLTARVDFEALAGEARAVGLSVAGPATQAAFLSRLGIEVRAAALARANPDSQDVLGRQLRRLTAADEMGELFKAICLSADNLPDPLGFGAVSPAEPAP